MPPYCVVAVSPGLLRAALPKAEFVRARGRRCLKRPNTGKQPVLSLGELEPFACALLAVLLAFVGTRVPRQEPELFQFTAQLGIEFDERAGDTQARCSGLAIEPPAVGKHQDVELVRRLRS